MTTLSYLNEPGVLWNLRCRYLLDAIYTYTGSILIAVNPFARLPHLYGPHMMEQYRGRQLGELSPHVYAIADAAYRQMRKEGRSQSILVRPAIAALSRCIQRLGSKRHFGFALVSVSDCSFQRPHELYLTLVCQQRARPLSQQTADAYRACHPRPALEGAPFGRALMRGLAPSMAS